MGAIMRNAVLLVTVIVVGMVFLTACGGDGNDAADTSAASITAPRGEPIVIRTRMVVAATPGSEPIATGNVLEGSTLEGSLFCAGGTILDSHASRDPTMKPYGLVARKITCPDGTVRMGITPKPPNGGPWTIVDGTGAFEGLRGSGEMKVLYDPDDDSLARETLTGTVTR